MGWAQPLGKRFVFFSLTEAFCFNTYNMQLAIVTHTSAK